jgi:hypothetical protein
MELGSADNIQQQNIGALYETDCTFNFIGRFCQAWQGDQGS